MSDSKNNNPDISALIDSANSGSDLSRRVYITFLLVCAYMAITIGATTDEQLLRSSPVNLPILNVGIPLVWFYLLVPWLMMALHLNLLLQLHFLARRVQKVNEALDALPPAQHDEWVARVHGFPFTRMLVEREEHFRGMQFVIAWLTVVGFPVLLLVAAQVRFLPYHDAGIIWSQRLAVFIDLVLLWVFWPKFTTTSGRWRDWFLSKGGWRQRAFNATFLVIFTIVTWIFSFTIATVPGESIDRRLSFLNGARAALFDAPGSIFHRNLQLAEATLLQQEPPSSFPSRDDPDAESTLAGVRGLLLAKRDLRFADLRLAVLINADLRGADLTGADLRGADLRHADLRPYDASLGGACPLGRDPIELSEDEAERTGLPFPGGTDPLVCDTTLERVRAAGTVLDYIDASRSDWTGADLRNAKLTNAILLDADLTGALLGRAELNDSLLEHATLDGADLRQASLVNVSMRDATAVEWEIESAILTGAELPSDVTIRGKLSELAGVRIRRASFVDANLSGANLESALLVEVTLNGVNLGAANLTGALIRNAQLRGAMLSEATLHGTEMRDVDIRGANMQGTELQSVMLQGLQLGAADLTGAIVGGSRISGRLQLADLRALDDTRLSADDWQALEEKLAPDHRRLPDLDEQTLYAADNATFVLCDADTEIQRARSECDPGLTSRYVTMITREFCEDEHIVAALEQRVGLWHRFDWRTNSAERYDNTPYSMELAQALLDNCRDQVRDPSRLERVVAGERAD